MTKTSSKGGKTPIYIVCNQNWTPIKENSFQLLVTNSNAGCFLIAGKCCKRIGCNCAWFSFLRALIFYLPLILVMLTVLVEENLWLPLDDTEFSKLCLRMNAGWFGGGRNATSLLSIEITAAMVGRSIASSCTHRSAMWMNLKISLLWLGSYTSGSIKEDIFPSLHCIQA